MRPENIKNYESDRESHRKIKDSKMIDGRFDIAALTRYNLDNLASANIIKPHAFFVRDTIKSLGIKEIKTYPVQDMKKEDKNSSEYVFPVHFDLGSVTYRFLNSKKMQDIVFYLPRDKFVDLQQKVTEYPAGLRMNNH